MRRGELMTAVKPRRMVDWDKELRDFVENAEDVLERDIYGDLDWDPCNLAFPLNSGLALRGYLIEDTLNVYLGKEEREYGVYMGPGNDAWFPSEEAQAEVDWLARRAGEREERKRSRQKAAATKASWNGVTVKIEPFQPRGWIDAEAMAKAPCVSPEALERMARWTPEERERNDRFGRDLFR